MAIGAAVARFDLQQNPPARIVVIATPLAAPCGACRQCLAEFGLEMTVHCVDAADHRRMESYKIADLLPNTFRLG
jgi:cytidine deaminase